MLHAIPYFYIGEVNVLSFSIPVILIAIVLAKILHLFILLKETARLNLLYSATILLFVFDFIFRFPFSYSLFLISRLIFHNGQFETGTWGMIYFGTFISMLPATYIVCLISKERKNFYKYLDILLLSHVPSMIVLRIGTALNHYHLGKLTNVIWGLDLGSGQIRHETSFYEIISYSILSIIVFKMRRRIAIPGLISLIIIAWISLSRIIIDSFRTSEMGVTGNIYGSFTANQFGFGVLFFLAIFLISRTISKHKGKLPAS